MLSNRPRDKQPGSADNQSKVCLHLGLIKGPQGQGRPGSCLSLNLLTEQPGCYPSPLVIFVLFCPVKAPVSRQRSLVLSITHLAAASGSGTHPASRVSLPSGQGDPPPSASLLPAPWLTHSGLQSSWEPKAAPGTEGHWVQPVRMPGL